ncbi:MAG: 2-polyprenyl-3-methyl-5-hydroxy-6-metoxy-1,4-benzoquinol methylase [Candidatus Poriferisodalaceae bacterium]|jgi:2-polyprenyl-3-methyl-5-hydroxy-6-metoxy-1,4-benzoquinol methylase
MTAAELDPDVLNQYSFTVWSYKQGEMVSMLIHIGDELGLFAALAKAGRVNSTDLATATGLHQRFLHEWLMGMAAAKLVTLNDDLFELPPEGAAILADEANSIRFAAGAFRGGVDQPQIEMILNSFRTGQGMSYEQQGPKAAAGLARMTGPFSRMALLPTIIPALDGVTEKLEAGGSVLDVGCGAGVTSCILAEAFPNARIIGYDPSEIAVAQARAMAEAGGLSNVEFVAAGAADVPANSGFDLVLTFDCLHDMPRPDESLVAIKDAMASNGTLLIKDIRSTGDFNRDRRNPLLALFYGFSVTSCLQSAMSEPGGLGLGTLGLHGDMARKMTATAGFTLFHQHDFDDNANLYYEVRA